MCARKEKVQMNHSPRQDGERSDHWRLSACERASEAWW